jgi:hypothetical protein
MNYYYLISALPKLKINAEDNSFDLDEVYDLIQRNLSEKDVKIYEAILYQNDNRNLLSIIFREYHQLEFDYIYYPSVVPFESLSNYRRSSSGLPDYMTFFLQDNAGIFSSSSLTDIELKLRRYFLEYVISLNSDFLLQYYKWQYHFEETVSAINQQRVDFLNPRGSHDTDFLNATSANLIKVDKNKLSAELLPLKDEYKLSEIEKMVDRFYWEFTESWSSGFSSNAVFSYVVKLLRLTRWTDISTDPKKVMDEFDWALGKVKNTHRSLKIAEV